VWKVVEDKYFQQFYVLDNGGRRSGGDRRAFNYSIHLPERRNQQDRRSGRDRRKYPRYPAKFIESPDTKL
jgi:hypothetical protein